MMRLVYSLVAPQITTHMTPLSLYNILNTHTLFLTVPNSHDSFLLSLVYTGAISCLEILTDQSVKG